MATQIKGSQIRNLTIKNAQIATDAAIAFSKLASLTAGYLVLGNGSNVATATEVTGDVTINSSGVTSISAGAIVDADINASAAIATSKLADGASFFWKDGSVAATGNFDLNSNKITNLANGVDSGDAVNKGQLDAAVSLATTGLSFKAPVRAATTANITLSNTQTIDGVSLIAGDRVLVKDQTTGSQNGIYVVVDGGSWTRALDANASGEVPSGTFVLVTEGTTNADSGFVLSTDDPIDLGTTSLSFVKFTTLTDLVAGAGLTKTGATIDVVSANGGIVVNANNIALTVDGTADSLDISASGIKLKDGSAGDMYVGNASGVFKRVQMSGDATMDEDGVVTVTSGGLEAANFVFNEEPTGSINGTNTVFSLAATPTAGTVTVFLNGVLQEPTADYSISGDEITFTSAPESPDTILCNYMV